MEQTGTDCIEKAKGSLTDLPLARPGADDEDEDDDAAVCGFLADGDEMRTGEDGEEGEVERGRGEEGEEEREGVDDFC